MSISIFTDGKNQFAITIDASTTPLINYDLNNPDYGTIKSAKLNFTIQAFDNSGNIAAIRKEIQTKIIDGNAIIVGTPQTTFDLRADLILSNINIDFTTDGSQVICNVNGIDSIDINWSANLNVIGVSSY